MDYICVEGFFRHISVTLPYFPDGVHRPDVFIVAELLIEDLNAPRQIASDAVEGGDIGQQDVLAPLLEHDVDVLRCFWCQFPSMPLEDIVSDTDGHQAWTQLGGQCLSDRKVGFLETVQKIPIEQGVGAQVDDMRKLAISHMEIVPQILAYVWFDIHIHQKYVFILHFLINMYANIIHLEQ